MVHTATNSVTTYFQYLCGHGALVSLPRIKGESPRTREHRIGIEKTAASQRRCDFCGPEPTVAVGLAELELELEKTLGKEEVMTVPATTEPTSAAKSPSRANGEAAAEPKRRGRSPLRKLSDEQELELTRLYSDTETAVPEIARRFAVGESSVYRIAQRHGASLRTKSSPDGRATRKPAVAAVAAVAQPKRAAAPKATRSAPRRAARSAAPSAPTAAATTATATKPRRAAASRKQAAPARRRATRTASTRVASASASRAATSARPRFRVVFRAETVIVADSMRAALAQAESRGATEITSIALAD